MSEKNGEEWGRGFIIWPLAQTDDASTYDNHLLRQYKTYGPVQQHKWPNENHNNDCVPKKKKKTIGK